MATFDYRLTFTKITRNSMFSGKNYLLEEVDNDEDARRLMRDTVNCRFLRGSLTLTRINSDGTETVIERH